ncbi:hypothetical protein N305_07760, partial [Manacus vitellinus]
QVVHVALSLCELHLVHALPRVPVQEGLSAEHRSELLRNAFEQLLDGRAVANEGGRHFEAARWNVTDRCLNVIGDPLNKIAAIFVLNVEHLLVHLFHGHAAPKDGGHRQIAAVTRVTRCHHVLGIEHLLGELGHGEGTVLLAAACCQRGKARHEEVETREGHHVDSQLAEVSVELAREAQGGGDTAHGGRHEVVQVP